MVSSPKLSKYFYEYQRLDGRLNPQPPKTSAAAKPASQSNASNHHPSDMPRRTGTPPGIRPNRLTEAQRKTLLGLLETNEPAEARRLFIDAGHGTVSMPTVLKYARGQHPSLG